MKTAELRQLTKEAKQFLAGANNARDCVGKTALVALENAWQCGKRLNAIKGIIGHGNWETWRENNFPDLDDRTAQRFMKIDCDNPKASHVTDLEFDSLRKHYLTFVPEKERPNQGMDVKLPRLHSFLNIVNEYERLKYRHTNGLQEVDLVEVREECRDLYDFLAWIYGDRKQSPWKK